MSILSILFFTAISGGRGGWWTACCPCSCPRLGFRLPIRFSWALNFVSLVLVLGLQTVCLSAPFLSVPSVCPVCPSCLSVCLSVMAFVVMSLFHFHTQQLAATTRTATHHLPPCGLPTHESLPLQLHPCWSNLLPPSPPLNSCYIAFIFMCNFCFICIWLWFYQYVLLPLSFACVLNWNVQRATKLQKRRRAPQRIACLRCVIPSGAT